MNKNESKNILIAGCGQLGSRHLQALMKSGIKLNVFVFDPNDQSLSLGKSRVEQVPGYDNHEINFFNVLKDVPAKNLDLVVIATNSEQRFEILKNILDLFDTEKVVLEKFLFQRVEQYEMAENIFKEKKIDAWVNCPRRLYPFYKDIKNRLKEGAISASFKGMDWGLACNGIHFIDLISFLTEEKITSIDCSELNKKIYPSKRPGYIEFFGRMKISFEKGSSLILVCEENGNVPMELMIKNKENSLLISEVQGVAKINDDELNFVVPRQSDLTHLIAEDILIKGSCNLTSYSESKELHLQILTTLMHFSEELTGKKHVELRIT